MAAWWRNPWAAWRGRAHDEEPSMFDVDQEMSTRTPDVSRIFDDSWQEVNTRTRTQEVSRLYDVNWQAQRMGDQKPPPLSAVFQDDVRPFIDLIDALRMLGLDNDISLPEVAVIGDQSSGKSSVLEAISGVQLPRGTGIVTRCPLALQLKSHHKDGHWEGFITYHVPGSSPENIHKRIANSCDVDKAIREAQDAIAGNNGGISDTLISLQITAHGVPDLTLIDLPGITRVAVPGQRDDIGEKIDGLIQKYITKEETIILAVVPANVDIATTQALRMAQKVDLEGVRTLGIVTKPDLIDDGTEDELIAIIKNRTLPLKKGYSCVKCRGQKAVSTGQSLSQAVQEEEHFFKDKPHFRGVDDAALGVTSLARKLTSELVEQIKRALPDIDGQVHEMLNETKRALLRLAPGVPEDARERTDYLLQLLQRYTDDVRDIADGEHKRVDGYQVIPGCREYFEQMETEIQSFRPEKSEKYIDDITEISTGQRGRELPGFLKYSTCEILIVDIVKKYEGPMIQTLENVSQLVGETFGRLATSKFENHPLLEAKIKRLVVNLTEDAEHTCRKALLKLLKMEKKPFAQDKDYKSILDRIKKQHAATQRKETPDDQPVQVPNGPEPAVDQRRVGDGSTESESLFLMMMAYLKICNRRIADSAPMAILYDMVDELSAKIRHGVTALATDPETLEALREKDDLARKRERLKKTLERLQKASEELAVFKKTGAHA